MSSTDTTDARAAERPTRLPGRRGNGPDGRNFPWGPIIQVHTVGDIDVLEFLDDRSNYAQRDAWAAHGRTRFAAYIAGRNTAHTYHSLDSALVGAIAYKRRGPNDQSARAFDLMTLGVLPDQDD